MLKKLLLSIIGLVLFTLYSCSPKHSEIIVAEYGKYNVTMEEFENAYAKNVGSFENAQKDSIQNYNKFLDLFVNFKMKLRDAQVRRLPEDEAIVNELSDYEKTIGASYLLEKDLYEKGIQDLYDKRKYELRVSHILLRTDKTTPEEAEKKALAILDSIKNGASFEDMVRKYSEDQFSKNKGGDVYYITAGTILPDFEDIAFNTPVGTVNQTPLKTKYGYHIIKVTDKIERAPQIRASHILIRKEGEDKAVDDKSRYQLVQDILSKLKNGEDFGELALQYSEDPGSKEKKGDLGFFARRQMVQPFDEAVFALNVGEISDVVETQFGFHIIKLTEKTKYPSFESEKKSLRDMFERTRKNSDYEKLIDKYDDEVKLVMHDEVFKEVVSNANEVKINQQYWESDLHNNFGDKVLFTIGDEIYTTDSLYSFAIKEPKNFGKVTDQNTLNGFLNDLKNQKVIEAKAKDLVNTDKEFAGLMDEYKNGILIFRLQEEEVWNKMKMDTTEILKLYEQTKDSYVWPNRVQYREIASKSDSLLNEILGMLKHGSKVDEVIEIYSDQIKINNSELIDANTNAITKAANELENVGDFTDVIRNVNVWSIIELVKKDASRTKTFDEARAEVTSAYQDIESAHLENQYVSRLKNTYEPELFYEELENAYKN